MQVIQFVTLKIIPDSFGVEVRMKITIFKGQLGQLTIPKKGHNNELEGQIIYR